MSKTTYNLSTDDLDRNPGLPDSYPLFRDGLKTVIWRRIDWNARSRGQLKCDGTRTETRIRLSAKQKSPFKSAGASVQSITGSRGVRISGSNAGYTMFRGSVKGTGYPHHSPVSPSLPLPCVTVCHHISTGFYYRAGSVLRFVTMQLWAGSTLTCTCWRQQHLEATSRLHLEGSQRIMCLSLDTSEDGGRKFLLNVGTYPPL